MRKRPHDFFKEHIRGIEAAWRKIYNLTAEHKHSRQTKENEREIEI